MVAASIESFQKAPCCIHNMKNSSTQPNLTDLCGKYFTYNDFVTCSATFKSLNEPIDNAPKVRETYISMNEYTKEILDCVFEQFGDVELTYGFCSQGLSRKITKGIAPRFDQHAGHKTNKTGKTICPRLGFASDFIVPNISMLVVAQWIVANCHFERLYFYGKNRPIHCSWAKQPLASIVLMKQRKLRVVPYRMNAEKFLRLKNT